MSLQLILKHSSVSGKAPTAAQLAEGEISVNLHADGPFLCCKDTAGDVIQLGGVTIGDSQPTSTKCGFWLDTSGAQPELKIYTGSLWASTAISPTITAITGTSPVTATTVSNTTTISVASASQTQAGVVELATDAETTTGSSSTKAVHPSGLKVELDKKADINSPTLTGTPSAPTQLPADNSTNLATTEFVATALTNANIQPHLWSRTSSSLSPVNAGDTLDLDNGLTAAGGIDIASTTDSGIEVDQNGKVTIQRTLSADPILESYSGTTKSFQVQAGGTVEVGGTIGSSPNILLNPTGEASFGGGIDLASTATEGIACDANGAIISQRTSSALSVYESYSGTDKKISLNAGGTLLLGGTLPSAANISLDAPNGNATLAGDVVAQGIQSTSQNGSQLAGCRNQIINGDFRVWQRGTTVTNTGSAEFTADRWRNTGSTVGATVIQRNVGPANIGYSAKISADSGSMQQSIELDRQGSNSQFGVGSTWTMSVWSDQDLTSVTPWARFRRGSAITTGEQDASSTFTDWQSTGETSNGFTRYYHTFTITHTVSDAAISCLTVVLPGGTVFGVITSYTGVQLEPGPVATPFEHRPIGTELALCHRYYQTCVNLRLGPTDLTSNTKELSIPRFVTMRADPTETGTASTSMASVNYQGKSDNLRITGATTTTSQGAQITNYSADAEL